MGNQKIMNLLIRSLDEELKPSERETLNKAISGSDHLRKEKEKLVKMRKLVGSVDYQFKHGFSDRVMGRLRHRKNGLDFSFGKDLSRIFTRVAISGVAAILILLITIYITTGSFSFNSLSGIQGYNEDNVISYLLYEE
jgi:hypothetical protein